MGGDNAKISGLCLLGTPPTHRAEPAAPPLGWREGLHSKSWTPVATDRNLWGVCGCGGFFFFFFLEGEDIHPSSSIPGIVWGTEFHSCHAASYLPSHVSPASSSRLPGGQSNLHLSAWLSSTRLGTRPWTRLAPAPVEGPLAGSQQANTLLLCPDLPYRAGIPGDHRGGPRPLL